MRTQNKIKKRSKAFTLMIILLIMSIAGVVTVNAWFIAPAEVVTLSGSGIESVTAAFIEASVTLVFEDDVLGIPGETQTAMLNIKDEDSTRHFVYNIVSTDPDAPKASDLTTDYVVTGYIVSTESGKQYRLGEIQIDKDDMWGFYDIVTADENGIDVPVTIYYYGAEVIETTKMPSGGTYDGNATWGHEFAIEGLKVECIQATPAAVYDVLEDKLPGAGRDAKLRSAVDFINNKGKGGTP